MPRPVSLLLLAVLAACGSTPDRDIPEAATDDDAPIVDRSDPGAPPPGYLQADFDPSAGLVVGVTQMIQHHPQTLVDLVRAVDGAYPVIGLTSLRGEQERVRTLLAENDLPLDHILLRNAPLQTMWIRDFGPLVSRSNEGAGLFLDGIYLGTPDNPDDDRLPGALSIMLGVKLQPLPLQIDGGMVLSNGRGLVLLATSVLQRHAQRGEPLAEIQKLVQASLPSREFVLIQPLPDEPTGHLDVFMALVAPDLCVVAQYAANRPRLADHVDAIETRIGGHPTRAGPLRVVRIPTPPPVDGAWFSYTNIVQLGDLVLVPTYQQVDDRWNRDALEFYRTLLPRRRIRAVDSTTIIQKHGAIRCVTFTLPADAQIP